MATPKRNDPYRNFNFIVEIAGIAQAGFTEVTMPVASAEIVEYREGNEKTTTTRKLPGRIRFSNLILRSGITDSRALYDWWKTVLNGTTQRKDISIVLLGEDHTPVKRWNIREAWPAKIEWPQLNAKGNEIAIETLEIAHEGIELA